MEIVVYNSKTINSMLYLRTIKDKYIELYNKFISQLHDYAKAIRILAKEYLPILLVTPLKLKEMLALVKETLNKKPRLQYSHKKITFVLWYEISDFQHRQFPIFIQPYTQQLLILYQLEKVPVPVIDKNTKADTYTQLQITKL